VLPRHRRHLRRFLDADDASLRADLVPEQAAAQAGPAAHVEDHLPGAERKRLDHRTAVGLERRRVTLVGPGALTVSQLPPRRGIQGRVHGFAPAFGGPEMSTVTTTCRVRVNGGCASRYRLPRTPQEHIWGTASGSPQGRGTN